MSASRLERSLVTMAKVGNDIIGLNIVTNALTILAKATLLRGLNEETKANSHLYTYLDSKSYGRCVVHMLPIMGRTMTDVYDDIQASRQRKLRGQVMEMVRGDGMTLQQCAQFQGDKGVVECAVRQNGLALQFANHKLRNNKWLVNTAYENNRAALQYASLRIQREIVAKDPDALRYASLDIQREIVAEDPDALQYASLDIQREIVAEDRPALQSADRFTSQFNSDEEDYSQEIRELSQDSLSEHRDDDDSIEGAKGSAYVFEWDNGVGDGTGRASSSTTSGESIGSLSRSQDSPPIEDVPKQSKKKQEAIMLVQEDGLKLQWVSKKLKANEEVVNAALAKNPKALRFASKKIQRAKIKLSPTWLPHVSEAIRNEHQRELQKISDLYNSRNVSTSNKPSKRSPPDSMKGYAQKIAQQWDSDDFNYPL